MDRLIDVLKTAEKQGIAIGHFNISDLTILKAVVHGAQRLNVPVIVGASEGERKFLGTDEIAALVKTIRENSEFQIFLNADHTHSVESALQAVRAGFDMIVFDSASVSFEKNVEATRSAVEAIKSLNSGVLVEGELGYIGVSSEIHDKMPEGIALTDPTEAKQFVAETGIDILAPAVGTMHGLLQSMVAGKSQKRLDIQRIREIKKATPILLTLHGGSGTNDMDFQNAIQAGISIIHINTELRLAWRKGLEEGLQKNPTEVAPYKILPSAIQAIEEVVMSRLSLFNMRKNIS
jgi:fructose-bisphosphate aldolase, class II